MRSSFSLLLLFIVLATIVPVVASSGPSPDDLERNRRLLEAWRTDPEHYARLRHDLKAFWELPPEARERLRQLDVDLHGVDTRKQKRLLATLTRYALWLERLPESDRQMIAAVDRSERVNAIRTVLDRQYLDSLPEKLRSELKQLPPSELRAQLDHLRQEDKHLLSACRKVALERPEVPPKLTTSTPASYRPTHLSEFPAEVRYYVDKMLWPHLKLEEADQIKKAEGAPWPLLARTIWELSAKHPAKLPGPLNGPRRYIELPQDFVKAMPAKDLPPAQRKHLNELLGRWPDFAAEYVLTARKNGVNLPRQLGPCHPKQFEPPVTQFIDRSLLPALSDKEKDELKAAEGRWPDYPKTLLELSRKHSLEIPLMRLPGPRELWEQARTP
jgi:hypothetical protein